VSLTSRSVGRALTSRGQRVSWKMNSLCGALLMRFLFLINVLGSSARRRRTREEP